MLKLAYMNHFTKNSLKNYGFLPSTRSIYAFFELPKRQVTCSSRFRTKQTEPQKRLTGSKHGLYFHYRYWKKRILCLHVSEWICIASTATSGFQPSFWSRRPSSPAINMILKCCEGPGLRRSLYLSAKRHDVHVPRCGIGFPVFTPLHDFHSWDM